MMKGLSGRDVLCSPLSLHAALIPLLPGCLLLNNSLLGDRLSTCVSALLHLDWQSLVDLFGCLRCCQGLCMDDLHLRLLCLSDDRLDDGLDNRVLLDLRK